jgi:hypothetical protein
MIYPNYPLAQELRVLSKFETSEIERYMKSILFFPSETIVEASQYGLFIFLKNEESLTRPLKTLYEIFNEALHCSALQIRYFRKENNLYEPIMHMRICVNNHFAQDVERDLFNREVKVLENYKTPNSHVLRVEGPLRNILGYQKELEVLTDRSAYCISWLDRYSFWRQC